MRAVNQIISYDLPFLFAALVPVMLAGSLRLSDIAAAQSGLWFIAYPVIGQLAFLAFIIAGVAAENRVPFDILEAESELVAGFRVEYSGMKFAHHPARRIRARPGRVVPRRAAVPRRVGRARARRGSGPVWFLLKALVRLPALHVDPLELHPHPRRPDPARVVEADAAGDAAAAAGDGDHHRAAGRPVR